MSKEEVLRRAIEKAQANGYRPLMTVNQVIAHNNQFRNPIAIIFTHDFAKAFWGRKVIDNDFADEEGCSDPYVCDLHCGEAWEYHLQRMVISDDPLIEL